MDHSSNISILVCRSMTVKNWEAGKDTISSIHLLKQNLATFRYFLALKINDPKNKAFNRKIRQLIEGGIIQKLEKDRFETIGKELRQKKKGDPLPDARILTFEHLELCFFAILICLSLCFVVFALECVTSFVQKKLNRR